MASLFTVFVYNPLLNGLVLLYNYLPGKDLGVAVIVFTILLKLVLYPLGAKTAIAQKRMQEIQPRVKALQEKFKGDKDGQARALLELYKQEGISPFAGIVPLLIQIPILFALFRLFLNGLKGSHVMGLYSFVSQPNIIRTSFLGMFDLSAPLFIIALLAGIAQFAQTKQAMAQSPSKPKQSGTPDMASAMQKQMMYILPAMTVLFAAKLPSVVGLYWIVSSVFSIWQQWVITKKLNGKVV